MYGETISGVTIIRAFGASSKFLRDMLRHVDTVSRPKTTVDKYLTFTTSESRTLIPFIGCGEVVHIAHKMPVIWAENELSSQQMGFRSAHPGWMRDNHCHCCDVSSNSQH